MHGVAVALLTEDKDRLTVLRHRLENSQSGRIAFSYTGFPTMPSDPILRQMEDVRTEVVLVDIDPRNEQRALNAIQLIRTNNGQITVFAVGEMSNPASIVATMRAGASEYLERNAPPEHIAEALARFAATRNKARASSGRARIFTITNAKGGAGATTVAVNTAISLQETHGNVLLVDFAPLGHAALHLNLRPAFGVFDALQNLHRLDSSLLEGLLTPYKGGLQLLAAPQQPFTLAPTAAELAKLFDLLVAHFRFVIVDCSNRVDQTARLLCELSNAVLMVAQADVVSLWSAGRMRTFLEEGAGRDRVRVVLNRYKKIPGFGDEDIEKATDCKLLWKLPNNYQATAPAIDKGVPVALQDSTDIGRAFRGLAAALATAAPTAEGSLDLVYQHDKTDRKKKTAGRLLISPLRAGQ
ncbi:MAG TPA: AAA family ATPase [Terriglobales bacterium]|nr:AAA family ATPase [Terriglobales bacterium]